MFLLTYACKPFSKAALSLHAYSNHLSFIAAVTIHIDAVACDVLFDRTIKFIEFAPSRVKDVPLLMTV
jgi:hypothetical protein